MPEMHYSDDDLDALPPDPGLVAKSLLFNSERDLARSQQRGLEMQNLDGRLAELREIAAGCSKDAEMCRRKAGDFEHEAMIAEAEIRGIELARAALMPHVGNGAEPPHSRQPKRDIKVLVRGMLTEDEVNFAYVSGQDTFPEDRTDQIARRVGCKPHRVRAIVESLRMRKEEAQS